MAQPSGKARQQKKRMEQAFAGAQGAPPPIAAAFAAAEQGKTADDPDPLLTAPARRAKLAEDLKTRGNAHYSHGDDAAAVDDYTAGLRACPEDDKTLRGALLSNRAAVHLRRKEHDLCIKDCNDALKLDASRAKCYYRRAAAREQQDSLEEAFKDLKICVQLEPTNKTAVNAARRVKEKLTEKLKKEKAFATPAERLALQICQCVDTEELDERKLANLFKAGASLAIEDECAAKALWRAGAGDHACHKAKAKGTTADLRKAAVCMLGAMAHKTAISEPSMVWQVAGVLRREGEGFMETDAADSSIALCAAVVDAAPTEDEEDVQGDADSEFMREVELDLDEDAISESDDDELAPSRLRAAADGAAAVVVSSALKHGSRSTRMRGMDLLVRWLAAPGKGARARLRKFLGLGEDNALRKNVLEGLYELLDSVNDDERTKSQACIARILRSVGDKVTGEYAWATLHQDFIEALIEASCRTYPLRAPDAIAVTEGAWSADLAQQKRKASLLAACHLACTNFVVECLKFMDISSIARLCATDEQGEILGCEALAACASSESGRSSLAPLVQAGELERLMREGRTTSSRSAAASAVAKLGLAAKALKAGSHETGKLLDAAAQLLKDEDSACRDRAVEVLAGLSGSSRAKEEIAHGSGRSAASLASICDVAKQTQGSDPRAYGLALILANLTVTNDELRRRHFREKEMDISPEQYDEFMRITKQKDPEDADNDTPDLAKARARKLCINDGVVAISTLASSNPSSETASKLADALCALATDDAMRGTLIQQGGFRSAVNLANNDKNDDRCRLSAAHAAGKVLITTDPRKLTDDQQLCAIRPLLWACRHVRATDLAVFEQLLALTNLLSLGATARRRVAVEKGIHALEYLQFSDHPEVKRAATEALCNMVPDRSMIKHLSRSDKMKLWLALCHEDGDARLVSAAVGCLAMACSDVDVARAVASNNGASALIAVLGSSDPSLVHRAAYCLTACLEDSKARALLASSDMKSAVEKASSKFAEGPAAGALKDASAALARDWPEEEEEEDEDADMAELDEFLDEE